MAKQNATGGAGRGTFYDNRDVLTSLAVGDVISEGVLKPAFSSTDAGPVEVMPGYVGHAGFRALAKTVVALWGLDNLSTGAPTRIASTIGGRGIKVVITGRVVLKATTAIDGAFFPWAILLGPSEDYDAAAFEAVWANETETTRDDIGHIAMVVDDSGNIQTYNCASAGDASLTDSTKDVATFAVGSGWGFEMTIEIPATSTSWTDIRISFRCQDSTGAWASILTDTAPAFTSASPIIPYMVMNINSLVESLTYKITKL